MQTVPRAVVEAMGGERAFRARLAAFRSALADHAATVDRPRPVEDPAVENLANLPEYGWAIEEPPEPEPLPEPQPVAPPPPPPVNPAVAALPTDAISPHAMLTRLPRAARVALRVAARDDPAGGLAEFHEALTVARRFLRLSDPELVAGLDALRAAGHLDDTAYAAARNPLVSLDEMP